MENANATPTQLLDIRAIMSIVSTSKPTIYRWMAEGKFPRPIKAGRKSLWLMSDIMKWIDDLVANRENTSAQ